MVAYTLRLPDNLHAALKVEAKAHGRSLHAQILWQLNGWRGDFDDAPAGLPLRLPPSEIRELPKVVAVRVELDSQGRLVRSASGGPSAFKPDPKVKKK